MTKQVPKIKLAKYREGVAVEVTDNDSHFYGCTGRIRRRIPHDPYSRDGRKVEISLDVPSPALPTTHEVVLFESQLDKIKADT